MKRQRKTFRLANGKYKRARVGDFVQIMDWFGDVWAEILQVFSNDPQYHSIVYATDLTMLGSDSVYEFLPSSTGTHKFWQIRNIVTRQGLKQMNPRILHMKKGTYGRTKNFCARSKQGWPKSFC